MSQLAAVGSHNQYHPDPLLEHSVTRSVQVKYQPLKQHQPHVKPHTRSQIRIVQKDLLHHCQALVRKVTIISTVKTATRTIYVSLYTPDGRRVAWQFRGSHLCDL
eukprot:m.166745 g.166745  ORF g.166745 m.166745 type:complete len:105 (+) comp16629_c1_seq3:159-473(+)